MHRNTETFTLRVNYPDIITHVTKFDIPKIGVDFGTLSVILSIKKDIAKRIVIPPAEKKEIRKLLERAEKILQKYDRQERKFVFVDVEEKLYRVFLKEAERIVKKYGKRIGISSKVAENLSIKKYKDTKMMDFVFKICRSKDLLPE